MLKARLAYRRMQSVAMLLFVALTAWAIRHVIAAIATGSARQYVYYYWYYLISFIILAFTVIVAQRDKPKESKKTSDTHHVAILVPAYNEDEAVLKDCLESMFNQTRKPEEIFVVDDGSTAVNYRDLQSWFMNESARHGVVGTWHRKKNGGKRHAQAVAVEYTPRASVYVTVDSDSVLDPNALEELLKPLDDPKVQSVAGVILARNNRTNLLARFTDLLFVVGQFIDRSMMSALGSVLVNSGGLAAYRAETLRENMHVYLNEEFFGRHIEFSDDSMLTLYSLKKGKTVQQPSAFVFTMMPDKLSHHIRQQIRWSKGSFIRSWWRLKYLPIFSFGFMRQTTGWIQFAVTTTLVILLGIINPIINKQAMPYMLLIPILVGYGQALRYFSVKRSDESLWSQILTYLMAPIAVLWAYFILRPIRLYAMATCFNTAWGTRKNVEVGLERQPRRYNIFVTLYITLRAFMRGSIQNKDITLAHISALNEFIAEYGLNQNAENAWYRYLAGISPNELSSLIRGSVVDSNANYDAYRTALEHNPHCAESIMAEWFMKYMHFSPSEKNRAWRLYQARNVFQNTI